MVDLWTARLDCGQTPGKIESSQTKFEMATSVVATKLLISE